MTTYEFHTAYARLQSVTGTRTQVEPADILNIRQSSISDAKKRGEIPAGWLLTLLKAYRVNPEWIVTGEGPQYLAGESGHMDVVRLNWHGLSSEVENILTRTHTEIVGAVKSATQAWELP